MTAGIFSVIRSRADALRVVRSAAQTFFAVSITLAITAWHRGWQDLVDAGCYVALASLMWRYCSPLAAFCLLMVGVMRFFVTVGMLLETEQVVWIYVIVTVTVIFAAIRSIEATLKIHGRFAAKEAGNG